MVGIAHSLEFVIVLSAGLELYVKHVCDAIAYHMHSSIFEFLFSAICESLCLNGGTCSAPGNCTCPARWTGSTCNEGNNAVVDTAYNYVTRTSFE